MPFGIQPAYLFRDNDRIYGDEESRFLNGTGIEEVKIAFRSPWLVNDNHTFPLATNRLPQS